MAANPSPARRLAAVLLKKRGLVAFATWSVFAVIYTIDLAYNLQAYGTSFFRGWLNLSAFITQPILIALLVYIALRSLGREQRVQGFTQALLARASIGILTTDASGLINGVNPALLKIMGLNDPARIIGRDVRRYPNATPAIVESLARCLQGEPFSLPDVAFTSSAGNNLYVSVHGSPLGGDGSGGIMLLVEDSTERHHWRDELRTSSERVQRHASELEILRDISIAISSTLDLDEIMRVAYQRISAVLNVSTFFIALCDEPTRDLNFEFVIDDGVPAPRLTQHLDEKAGLSGWIIQNRKPLLVGDLRQAQDLPVTPGQVGSPARSWLGVPLVAHDRVVGVMSAQSYSPHQFDEGHLRLLGSIANEIALAIENGRLFAQIRDRVQELSTANEIALAISGTLNLDQVLQLFFDRLSVLFNVEAGALVLLDPATDQLVFEVVHGGAGESLRQKRMPRNEGIVGWVVEHAQPILVPDVSQDSRWFKGIDQESHFVTRSILAAPIKVQERTIGAVELINRRDGALFTEADCKLLGMFAASAGIAIENARLHRQTERRLTEVSTLNRIANQLATSLEVDRILSLIASELRESFGCQTCAIHLTDPERKILDLAAISSSTSIASFDHIPLGSSIVGRVATEREPVYVERAADAPQDSLVAPGTESQLVVPLASWDHVLGTLSLHSENAAAFSEDDRRLLLTAAAQIATAVENAQLYAQLKERARRLEQAYDELKELDRLKTEFVQNVSHELRTPLTFIKGYIELLRENALGELPDAARDGLDTVAEKADALTRLVNDILSMQRAENQGFKIRPVNLSALVRATVQAAFYSAAQAGIEMQEEIAAGVPEVPGDSAKLAHVFENLIENAIKFSPEGGVICVRVHREGVGVQVEVEDHGIGIPEDQLDKIFERFYQVDGSTTRRFGGAGLGLSIVKQTVDAHQGRVWATSQVGAGSTFYVWLPCGDPASRLAGVVSTF